MVKDILRIGEENYPVIVLSTELESDIAVYLLQKTNLDYYMDMVSITRTSINGWDLQSRTNAVSYMKKKHKILNTIYFHWNRKTLPSEPKAILKELMNEP